MTTRKLIQAVKELKKKKKAIILAHNYQYPEIYEVADFIGDSYGLACKAKEANAEIIVFCGVRFMAETAKILNPKKKVLLPTLKAGCFLANMITVEKLRELKRKHPKAKVVSYINSTVEVKAESDICCTSSNAVKVINSLEGREVIFVPDSNLADYVSKFTNKKIIKVKGFCVVHTRITEEKIEESKKKHPDALIILHPEVPLKIIEKYANHVTSTSGMIKYALSSPKKEFLIGTECGMIERLKREVPGKKFYALTGECVNMKQITLQNTYESLRDEKYEIIVPADIAKKAGKALEKMVRIK